MWIQQYFTNAFIKKILCYEYDWEIIMMRIEDENFGNHIFA